MKRRQHYNTKQAMAGARQCNYCGQYAPVVTACKCSVTLYFRGDQDVVDAAIDAIQQVMELIDIDEEYKGGIESSEVTITAVFKAPVSQFGPFKVQP